MSKEAAKKINGLIATLLARGISEETILKTLERIRSKKTETVSVPNLPFQAVLACYAERMEEQGIHFVDGWSTDWNFLGKDRGKTFLVKEIEQGEDKTQTNTQLTALYEEGYTFRAAPFLEWILREAPEGHFCCPLEKRGMPKMVRPSDEDLWCGGDNTPCTIWLSPEFTNYWMGPNHVRSLSLSASGSMPSNFGKGWVYVLFKEVK